VKEPSACIRNIHTELKECEEWLQTPGSWRKLPSMREARSWFTPCELNGSVYLCGTTSSVIEAFHLQSSQFSPIQVSLAENSACILFVEIQQLVVVSRNYTSRWQAGQESDLVQVAQSQHAEIDVRTNMPPVLQSGLVLFSTWGKCYCLRVDGSEKAEVGRKR